LLHDVYDKERLACRELLSDLFISLLYSTLLACMLLCGPLEWFSYAEQALFAGKVRKRLGHVDEPNVATHVNLMHQ
jgi:hypothetical protein